jgi:mono/diheme cytochrome c family protein
MGRVETRTLQPWAFGLLLATGLVVNCGGDESAPQTAPPATASQTKAAAPAKQPTAQVATESSEADLVARGERVYRVNCIACHARDPNQDGGLGPAIAGSSLELLEARVIHGTYPPGYTPKRDTRLMIPLPHLAPDLPALAAYLAKSQKAP